MHKSAFSMVLPSTAKQHQACPCQCFVHL